MDAGPATPLTRSRWLIALCLAVVAGGTLWSAWDMFGVTRRPLIQGWDDSFYYYWLPSVVIDGDVDFSNQLAQSRTLDASSVAEALDQPLTAAGLLPNKYPPGWALGSLPFFLLVHAFTPADATGFEPAYLIAVWLGQLLYAGVGVWLAIRIATRFFSVGIATPAVLVAWLASPLIYYQSARLAMPHSQMFTLAMLAFWCAFRIADGDRRARWWALLGVASAMLVVTRNVAVVYLLWPALVVVRNLRSVRAGVALLGAALPVIAVQLLAWKALYGSWFVYSYGGERFDFGQLHLGEILFSPRHGWFYWHPLLAVGIASFAVWAWRRTEGRAWLVSLAAIALLSAAWPTWWLGSSFGYRGFEVPTLFAALGLGALLQWAADRRALRIALAALAAGCIAWNLALLGLFLTQRIPREAPVTHAQSARALAGWLIGRPAAENGAEPPRH
jgi:hypothetical protein